MKTLIVAPLILLAVACTSNHNEKSTAPNSLTPFEKKLNQRVKESSFATVDKDFQKEIGELQKNGEYDKIDKILRQLYFSSVPLNRRLNYLESLIRLYGYSKNSHDLLMQLKKHYGESPESVDGATSMALFFAMNQQFGRGIAYLKEVTQFGAAEDAACVLRILMYADDTRTAKSIAARVVAAYPENLELGFLQAILEEKEQSFVQQHSSLKISSAMLCEAMVNLTAQKEYGRVLALAEMLKIEPTDNPRVGHLIANAYLQKRNVDKALKIWQKLIKIAPFEADSHTFFEIRPSVNQRSQVQKNPLQKIFIIHSFSSRSEQWGHQGAFNGIKRLHPLFLAENVDDVRLLAVARLWTYYKQNKDEEIYKFLSKNSQIVHPSVLHFDHDRLKEAVKENPSDKTLVTLYFIRSRKLHKEIVELIRKNIADFESDPFMQLCTMMLREKESDERKLKQLISKVVQLEDSPIFYISQRINERFENIDVNALILAAVTEEFTKITPHDTFAFNMIAPQLKDYSSLVKLLKIPAPQQRFLPDYSSPYNSRSSNDLPKFPCDTPNIATWLTTCARGDSTVGRHSFDLGKLAKLSAQMANPLHKIICSVANEDDTEELLKKQYAGNKNDIDTKLLYISYFINNARKWQKSVEALSDLEEMALPTKERVKADWWIIQLASRKRTDSTLKGLADKAVKRLNSTLISAEDQSKLYQLAKSAKVDLKLPKVTSSFSFTSGGLNLYSQQCQELINKKEYKAAAKLVDNALAYLYDNFPEKLNRQNISLISRVVHKINDETIPELKSILEGGERQAHHNFVKALIADRNNESEKALNFYQILSGNEDFLASRKAYFMLKTGKVNQAVKLVSKQFSESPDLLRNLLFDFNFEYKPFDLDADELFVGYLGKCKSIHFTRTHILKNYISSFGYNRYHNGLSIPALWDNQSSANRRAKAFNKRRYRIFDQLLNTLIEKNSSEADNAIKVKFRILKAQHSSAKEVCRQLLPYLKKHPVIATGSRFYHSNEKYELPSSLYIIHTYLKDDMDEALIDLIRELPAEAVPTWQLVVNTFRSADTNYEQILKNLEEKKRDIFSYFDVTPVELLLHSQEINNLKVDYKALLETVLKEAGDQLPYNTVMPQIIIAMLKSDGFKVADKVLEQVWNEYFPQSAREQALLNKKLKPNSVSGFPCAFKSMLQKISNEPKAFGLCLKHIRKLDHYLPETYKRHYWLKKSLEENYHDYEFLKLLPIMTDWAHFANPKIKDSTLLGEVSRHLRNNSAHRAQIAAQLEAIAKPNFGQGLILLVARNENEKVFDYLVKFDSELQSASKEKLAQLYIGVQELLSRTTGKLPASLNPAAKRMYAHYQSTFAAGAMQSQLDEFYQQSHGRNFNHFSYAEKAVALLKTLCEVDNKNAHKLLDFAVKRMDEEGRVSAHWGDYQNSNEEHILLQLVEYHCTVNKLHFVLQRLGKNNNLSNWQHLVTDYYSPFCRHMGKAIAECENLDEFSKRFAGLPVPYFLTNIIKEEKISAAQKYLDEAIDKRTPFNWLQKLLLFNLMADGEVDYDNQLVSDFCFEIVTNNSRPLQWRIASLNSLLDSFSQYHMTLDLAAIYSELFDRMNKEENTGNILRRFKLKKYFTIINNLAETPEFVELSRKYVHFLDRAVYCDKEKIYYCNQTAESTTDLLLKARLEDELGKLLFDKEKSIGAVLPAFKPIIKQQRQKFFSRFIRDGFNNIFRQKDDAKKLSLTEVDVLFMQNSKASFKSKINQCRLSALIAYLVPNDSELHKQALNLFLASKLPVNEDSIFIAAMLCNKESGDRLYPWIMPKYSTVPKYEEVNFYRNYTLPTELYTFFHYAWQLDKGETVTKWGKLLGRAVKSWDNRNDNVNKTVSAYQSAFNDAIHSNSLIATTWLSRLDKLKETAFGEAKNSSKYFGSVSNNWLLNYLELSILEADQKQIPSLIKHLKDNSVYNLKTIEKQLEILVKNYLKSLKSEKQQKLRLQAIISYLGNEKLDQLWGTALERSQALKGLNR